ncbi:hypothetical protein TcBrA4_0117210 [Trypanosoma cruzi]|nr:hypothetical protein TcBrA4_0117210 [Trypanosoma cruzi]
MILRSGAGLASRWTEASFFDDARGPSDAVPPSPCRTSRLWRRVGVDTVRLPRRRCATYFGRTQREGIAWCAGTPNLLRPAAADGGAVCPAAAMTCQTKLRCRSIALPSRRTGWDSRAGSHRPDDGRPCPRQTVGVRRCRTERPRSCRRRSSGSARQHMWPQRTQQLALPHHGHGGPHTTQQACGRQRARTPTQSECCPGGAAENPRGGGGAGAARRRIGLPRLRRAAVGNIAREHSPQRSRLAGECATSVGRNGTGAGALRAQPALAHRQRCQTQSRCQSGRRRCDARTPQRCTRSALVPLRHSQASPTPRPCVVAWIQADVGGVPAALTGGSGPVLRSHLGRQRAAGVADNSLCAACVLPLFADGSGVPIS